MDDLLCYGCSSSYVREFVFGGSEQKERAFYFGGLLLNELVLREVRVLGICLSFDGADSVSSG